jgi:hypothetical protein
LRMDSRPVFSSRSDGPNASGRFSSSCQPVCESSASRLVGEILPASVILETKTFNEQIRSGNLNPFNRSEIVICSYQFARSKEPYIRSHERDPGIKADSETIRKSLEGNWRPEHLFTLARSRDLYRVYQQQIVNCDLETEKMLPEFEPRVDPAERPLPADRKRRRASRKQQWPPRPEFDLRTETYKLFGVDVTQIPGLQKNAVVTV